MAVRLVSPSVIADLFKRVPEQEILGDVKLLVVVFPNNGKLQEFYGLTGFSCLATKLACSLLDEYLI